MATTMTSSRLETEICDILTIKALTEPQKCSISDVIKGSDSFLSVQELEVESR